MTTSRPYISTRTASFPTSFLSPARPAGYAGDAGGRWIRGRATCSYGRWPATGARSGIPAFPSSGSTCPHPARAQTPTRAGAKRCAAWGSETAKSALFFLVDHVERLRHDGYINRLKVFDVSQMGALAGQFYYEGAYELAPDEALIVEAKVPSRCDYGSILLTNEIYETTDWYNNQSSLNDSQWGVDADGVVRVVISAKDPGVPNWLDIAGYPEGSIQGRWTGCNANPVPSVRKVRFDSIRQALPAWTRPPSPPRSATGRCAIAVHRSNSGPCGDREARRAAAALQWAADVRKRREDLSQDRLAVLDDGDVAGLHLRLEGNHLVVPPGIDGDHLLAREHREKRNRAPGGSGSLRRRSW